MMDKLFCINCGDECNQVEETFDYAGTHCNHGQSGTHRTGNYVSDCCLDYTTDVDLSQWDIKNNKFKRNGSCILYLAATSYHDAIRQIIEIEGG